MVCTQNLAGLSSSISGQASTKSTLRRTLRSQASRLALRSTIGIAAAAAGVTLLAPGQAWADCLVGATTVQCDNTVTTDTTFPANSPLDRHYQGLLPTPIILNVDPGTTVSGNGLAIVNLGAGGITATNNGTISVDAGNTPSAGGTAALSLTSAGGPITYTGGSIINNGNGNAFDVRQTGGVGSVNINVSGAITAATGEGITVRDVATSTGISITTGAITALTAGKDGIDAQSSSLTGNITEVANGNIQAGNAGMVGAILNAAGTGNIDVTANGSIDARFGIDAENFGSGSTTVTTVGPVNVTTGNGIFALSTGGDVTVTAGDVTSTSNTAIIAQQTKAAGTGSVVVAANNVSGTTGINARNFGSGLTSVSTTGAVNATTGAGISALSNGGDVIVNTGAVTSTDNTAIIAQQTNAAGTGAVIVGTTGNVSGTTGIDAQNLGTGLTAVVAGGTVTGTAAEGIKAVGNDAVIVTAFDTVTGATRGLSLVGGTGGAGDILVNGPGGFVGGTDDAANILNNGSGSVTVALGGASSSAGGNGIFVRDTAIGGDISVTTGAVTALTLGKNAIDVITGSATGNVTEVANGNIQAGNAGMVAAIVNAASTGNVNVTANGSIDARFGIDAENFGSGDTSVTTVGPVNVTTGNGIFAKAVGGNVSVAAGDVTSTGNTAIIARQTKAAGAGYIDLFAGNVSGTTGIEATNSGTGFTSVIATGTVTGTGAEGIIAIGNDAVGILTLGTVTGATRGLTLVGGTGGSGDILVTGSGFVGGTGDAANILNNGSGTVTVNVLGASSSAGGNGIFVRDTAAGGDISVTTGAVTALTLGKNGIDVITGSTAGNVTEVANGNIQAGNAGMVAAIVNAAGTGNIDVTANGSIDARFGVDAENFGAGSTTVTTVGPVNVTSGNGIFALATGGNVSVNAGDVTSTGNTAIIAQQTKVAGAGNVDVTAYNVSGTTGIDARNFGTGNATVTTIGAVNATTGNGISALTNGGDITVNTNAVTSTGNTAIIAQQTNVADNGAIGVGATTVSGTTGIDVHNFGTGGIGIVTTGFITGTAAEGIKAVGNAGVFVVAGQTVTGATRGLSLIGGTGGTGDISVTGTGGFVGGTDDAANIFNNGAGTTTVNISGASSSAGGNGIFVRDTAIGGNVSVTTGAVTALTAGKNAVDIISSSTAGNVTVVTNGAVQAGNAGIVAALVGAAATGNVTVTANGSLTARFGVDAENFGTGSTSVTTVGAVNATTGNGIFALTKGGNVTVNAGAVTATGNTAIIAQQTAAAGTGAINVTAGNVSGTTGIVALNSGTGAIGITANGTVTGTGAEGILATGNAAVSVAVANTVTGATRGLSLSGGTGGTGNISVTGAGGFVGGTGDAANIANNGAGTVTYNVSGASSSTGGNGIVVGDTALGGSISITTGAVTALTAGKNAVYAASASLTGNVTEVANGNIRAGNAGLVAAILPAAATGNVNVTTNGSVDARFGVDAENQGLGTTTVTTVGPVTATTGTGVYALSHNGNVTVTTGNVTSTGSTGIFATQTGTAGAGAITVTANGSTGGTSGVVAQNFGTGWTTVTTVGPVTSTSGNGIFATATGGNVTVTTGSVSSTGASAIVAQDTAVVANTGKIDVTLTAGSTVTANTAGAFGIRTNSGVSSGTTTINVNGTIHAAAAGISSSSTIGNIITNVSATGAIDPLIGIDQTTVSGAISVNNSGLIQGDNIGVRLNSTGVGVAGALTVAQTSTGRISSIVGVDLTSVNAALVVSNAGQITATGTAIKMAATGTGAATILNSGTITGGTNAVLATLNNTSFTLNNVGILSGALNVSGSNVAASTVTNAAGASMNFGSGASSVSGNFVNAGSATIGAGGSVLFAGNTVNSNRITFAGAGTFTTNGAMTNTGIINAQNNITSNVVTVGGGYTGGGQFFADYSTSTATADRLNIGGAASGNTNVTMNLVGPRAFVAGGFLPVVTVTPGAAATAFTSNTVFPTTGFILESFGQNPSSNKQFGLIQQINPEAAMLGGLSYVAEAASATLDDPISPYLSARANPSAGQKTFSLWMRGAGGHTRETIASTITGGGVTLAGSGEVRTDHMAMTVGADMGLLNLGGGGWNLHFGLLGGWYNGRADLSSAQQLRVETPFLGAYVAAGNGAFQFDGTVRREWRHYKIVLPVLFGAGAPQKLNGDATAGSVHASYRFGGKTGFGATPFIGFNYADSTIDSLPIDAISAYIPGGDKTETGEGGLRVSYRAGSDANVVVEPFASASYLKNWSRGDSAVFTFGAPVTNFALATTTWDDAVRYSVGVTAKARDGRVSGFLVGNINEGSGLHSFSLNAGVRFNF